MMGRMFSMVLRRLLTSAVTPWMLEQNSLMLEQPPAIKDWVLLWRRRCKNGILLLRGQLQTKCGASRRSGLGSSRAFSFCVISMAETCLVVRFMPIPPFSSFTVVVVYVRGKREVTERKKIYVIILTKYEYI